MNIKHLVGALDAQRNGSAWLALCPAHDDRNASLAITEKDGKILVHCHAGCNQRAVLAALRANGLWEYGETPILVRRIVATYDYTDEAGEPLYQVVRYEPKAFHQRR